MPNSAKEIRIFAWCTLSHATATKSGHDSSFEQNYKLSRVLIAKTSNCSRLTLTALKEAKVYQTLRRKLLYSYVKQTDATKFVPKPQKTDESMKLPPQIGQCNASCVYSVTHICYSIGGNSYCRSPTTWPHPASTSMFDFLQGCYSQHQNHCPTRSRRTTRRRPRRLMRAPPVAAELSSAERLIPRCRWWLECSAGRERKLGDAFVEAMAACLHTERTRRHEKAEE